MKTLSISILALIVILCHSNMAAQDVNKQPSDTTKFKHSIGAGAGFTTGSGLSYRYTPKRFGVQINFAPIQNEDIQLYSAGLTLIYYLLEKEKTNLFMYLGNSYYYESSNDSMPELPKKTTKYFNTGLGVGIEIIMLKRISFNFMAGYALYKDFSQFNFTGEVGIYYKF